MPKSASKARRARHIGKLTSTFRRAAMTLPLLVAGKKAVLLLQLRYTHSGSKRQEHEHQTESIQGNS